MDTALPLYRLCPRENSVLLLSIEDIANDNVRAAIIIKGPCGVDGGIVRMDVVNDDVRLMHGVRFAILAPRDPDRRAEHQPDSASTDNR